MRARLTQNRELRVPYACCDTRKTNALRLAREPHIIMCDLGISLAGKIFASPLLQTS